MEKTPTEIAFEKAQAFDALIGYVNEELDKRCELRSTCSERLLRRYNLVAFGPTSMIIGILEEYFMLTDKIKIIDNGQNVTGKQPV